MTATRSSQIAPEQRVLREALAPYIDAAKLRHLAVHGGELRQALRCEQPPAEVDGLLQALRALLEPQPGEPIHGPADLAALLMVEMSQFDQEHFRVICLNAQRAVQKICTVYIGNVTTVIVRIGEVFKEALKLNSPAIILAHCHPTGNPTPSDDDVAVTKEVIAAGKLLDIHVLDHLVIGRGSWVSLRERERELWR